MNKKSTQERAQILQLLVEGNSLRSTSRITGASKNTVTKLLVEAGEACAWYQDRNLRNLPCKRIQCDEIWSFVYAKEKNVTEGMAEGSGDVWTWTAIDAETKLVPSWRVGSRDAETANEFMKDLAGRMAWFKSILDIHNKLKQKDKFLSLQIDVTATPRHDNGAIFVQTVSD